ncbi:ParB/RepB/Spo0J family partition protein [Alloscardovia omnicolens]|uniref:ParB/RepB/Spo0J family partition protein n=1 Tax=Alloscardovia omnicolens TaxID=419015 RepID=UPI003A63085E
MAAGRSRLGKGLGALFPTIEEESEESNVSRETSHTSQRTQPGVQVKKNSSKKRRAVMPGIDMPSSVEAEEERPNIPSLKDSIPHYESTAALDALLSSTEGGSVVSGLRRVDGAYLTEVKLDDIVANEHQPRQIFDEDELIELSHSIQEVGVLQPIVVREVDPATHDGHHFELIMGERRTRASRLAQMEKIPAIVKTTADDAMLRDALLENLHRVALNPLEEAAAYQQMLKEFGLTQEKLAQSISKSRPQITNTLRLLQLPAAVQKKVAAGVLSAGHARALLSLNSAEDMEKLANRIIAEGLSVRATEELVTLMTAGESQTAKKRVARSNPWDNPELVQRLENRFDTRVAIKGSAKRGRIEITFTSQEDLDRIIAVLSEEHQQSGDGWM